MGGNSLRVRGTPHDAHATTELQRLAGHTHFQHAEAHVSGDPSSENVVSRVRRSRRSSRNARVPGRLVWLIVMGIAIGGVVLAPNRPARGVFVVLLVITAVAGVVTWLAGTAGRLSGSGKEMGDDWQNQWHAPPPP